MADSLSVLLAAAGTGSRMGSDINKQYILLKDRPVICYSLDLFESMSIVEEVVIAAHPTELEYCSNQIVSKFGYKKVTHVVAGGPTRQDSVWHGLQMIAPNKQIVAIHDGARPLMNEALFLSLVEAVQQWGAAIPGISARDSLKLVDEKGFVIRSLDRSTVMAVQTPQLFRYSELVKAYEKAWDEGFQATDDAALYERYIGRVKIVPGDYRNIKITTQEDLIIGESYLERGEMRE